MRSTILYSDWSSYLKSLDSCSNSNAANLDWSKYVFKPNFDHFAQSERSSRNKGSKTAEFDSQDCKLI